MHFLSPVAHPAIWEKSAAVSEPDSFDFLMEFCAFTPTENLGQNILARVPRREDMMER